MNELTSIQVEKNLVKALKKAKGPQQSYTDFLKEMYAVFKTAKEKRELDEFIFQAQREKMKEIWDNEYDKAWDSI